MPKDNAHLIKHLEEQGLHDSEITRVLRKLEQLDRQTIRESVFDSIERGTFNLQAIVDEVKQDNSIEE
ncbi:MAG: hypothetical protein AAF802_25620 [Planctomycetota bacterium]